MWSRIGGVAGNIRSNVSHLAKDILEGDNDSPRQGFGHEVSEQNTQPSLPRPFQQASQQRPYFQAAVVDNAQPAADAHPPPQQVPLQQIPFFSPPKAKGQPRPKPALFVPGQPASRPAPAFSPPAPTQHVSAPALSQAVPQGRQNPAVSSRLSALKARLDTDKQKAGSESNKTARTGIAAVSGGSSPQATAMGHQGTQLPSKPHIPFFNGTTTASSSSSPAKPSASNLADNDASQLSSPKPPVPVPSVPQPRQVDGPFKHMQASRPQSSSSQHQLHDLGFEDVDLDSPDASVSVKTRSDHARPANRNHIMPIPFMQQQTSQGQASSSLLQPDDFDLTDSASAVTPSLHQSDADVSFRRAPLVEASSADLDLPGSIVQVGMDGNQSVTNGSDSDESTHGSTPADVAASETEVPSVVAAGPFSTYSGPGSTSSSTPASPGGGAGIPPTRRSSFLPRGMSSHLQKALKATAAAASKASAAIAPPPNTPLPTSSWQEAAPPPSLSLPIPKGEQDPEFPFQQPWGPSGPASTGSQGRKENGAPWWQQQLRNLQQNLHSPQQQQSDAAPDADADTALGPSHLLLNGPFQPQPAMPVSDSSDLDDPKAHLDGQQTDSMLPSTGSFPPPTESTLTPTGSFPTPTESMPTPIGSFPPLTESTPTPTGSQPWAPHRANHEHSNLSADSSHQHRQQVELDSMRIMESLGDGDSMDVSQEQPAASTSAVNSNLLDLQGAGQHYPTERSLLDSGQDATADSRVEEREHASSSLPSNDHVSSPTWLQAAESAQPVRDALQDTATSSAQQPQLSIPFTSGATAAGAATDDDDDDLFGLAAAVPSRSAEHHTSVTSQDPENLQDRSGRSGDGVDAMQQPGSMPQGSSTAELTQQLSQLQRQLHESQQRSHQLQSALDSWEATGASELQQHKQQLQAATHQHQQQLQLLRQQALQHQAEAAREKKRADNLQQRVHSSEQQAQKLQRQLSQQLKGAQEAEAEAAVLKEKLKQAQRQLLAAEAELASYQQEADSQMSHQLHEQHQELREAKQALQSAQAEMQKKNGDLSFSQAELESMRAKLQASDERVLRATQQAVELDEMKLTHTQLRDAHAQLQEQLVELTEQHRQQSDASAQADVVAELTNEIQQVRQDLAGQRAKTMALQQALEDQGEDMEAAAAAAVASSAASEDLHANLEGQLRASRADMGRLQSEVKRLQAAATAASRVSDAVTSPFGRDTSFLEEDRRLKSQLEASETKCNLLQKEVAQMKAAAVAASNQAAGVESVSPVSRDGSQTASSSGRAAGMRSTLPNGVSQGVGQEGPAIVPADGSAQEGFDTNQLQQRLTAAEQDRDKAKKQLNRLKQQMMTEQEDEEEKVKWRVDAEVKLAMEEFRAAESEHTADTQGEAASLRDEVSSSNAQIQQMHADLQAWEQAVSSRDTELRNLQAALGELTFESEAADRLRGELRSANRQVAQLQQQLQESAEQLQAAEEAATQARQLASDASHGTEEQQRAEKQLQEEAAMLRRALNESMRRVASLSSEGNAQVDRRIVVKLLVTFFERGQSQEVLQLMARILAFTDEDKARVGLTRQRKGVLSRVAGALSLSSPTSKASSTAADDSLADQWLDFLIQQADAADAAESAAAISVDSSITSTPPRSKQSLSLEVSPRASLPLHDWSSTQTLTQQKQQV